MRKYQRFIPLALSALLFLSGCTNDTQLASPTVQKEPKKTPRVEVTTKKQPVEQKKSKEEDKKIDLMKVKPNEAGKIMVLMYHNIAEPEGEWTRTPDNFRKDLQILYDKGYRPISLKDYISGNITTEAGYTPIVLTFDDGRRNNFDVIKNDKGELVLNPDSAVAILEQFNRKHPDFPLKATFFVNNNVPFEQAEYLSYKLNYIIDKGMDLGNHTSTHSNLTIADAQTIQKEIAGVVKMVGENVSDYKLNTLALPFGSRPKDKTLYTYLEEGSFGGTSYKNEAILNVGWDPDKSPYHKNFNPLSIHRVRASELQKYVQGVGLYDWLKEFDNGRLTRFVSDGDPNTVTVPQKYKDRIDVKKIGNRKIRSY